MEQIGKLISNTLSDGKLNLTPLEYILTPEEEAQAIQAELSRVRSYYEWKMNFRGLSKAEVAEKMREGWKPDIDTEAIKQRANLLKHRQLEDQAARTKEKEAEQKKREELKAFWTAKNFYKLMQYTHNEREKGKDKPKPFIYNQHTAPLIKTICFFLSRDGRFETELGHSLDKGLCIRGVSGLGKTYLVECVAKNELNPVRMISMIEITDALKSEGEYTLDMQGCKILYLDDVGTEETPVNYYGTKINWFKDFIELYYSKHRPFNQLIISSNLNYQQMEDKYGFRVRSRRKDMFNTIDVTGEDLRG